MPVNKRIQLLLIISLLISSCMKDDQTDYRVLGSASEGLPVVSTRVVSNVTQNTAMSGGRVISDNGSHVVAYGVCWSTLPDPTINDKFTNDGSGNGDFTSTLTDLSLSTKYYLRAFAKNANGVSYGNQETFTTDSVLHIGMQFQGGLVFYIDPSGVHGLVCTEQDISIAAPWGCANTAIAGADDATIGSGEANTNEIVNDCHDTGIAAKLCADADINGFTDWYLPSKEELKLMYANLQAAQLGNFTYTAYWSSTEMTNVFAWQLAFNSGIVQGASKSVQSAVRAVRAF
jgi:hypothetical protein